MMMTERGAASVAGIGGFMVWFSTLDLSTLSYIVGITVALLSMAYGFYFSLRRHRREQELHDIQIKSILDERKRNSEGLNK